MTEGARSEAGLLERIAWVGQYLAALILLLVMIAITTNAVGRRLLGGGLHFVTEISGFLFLEIIFLGLAGAMIAGEHISVEFINALVKKSVLRKLIVLLVSTISIAFVGLITVATIVTTVRLYLDGSTMTGDIRMPIWPVMAIVPVGTAALGALLLKRFWRELVQPATSE